MYVWGWMGGWLGDWVGGWLAGWLVGANERTRPLVKVPFTLMTKNRTSLNGTDEWLWKQHLICIEGASLSTRAESRSVPRSFGSSRFPPLALYFASLRIAMKRALSFIYHRFSIVYFIQITRRAPARLQNGESLYDCPSPPIVTRKPTTTLLL